MANGGIIGPLNIPTSTTATGVWQQDEQYEAKVTDTWPQRALFTTKSARFNSGSSDYLNRTLGTPTDAEKWTWSCWIKRSTLGATQTLFSYDSGSNLQEFIGFNSTDSFRWYHRTSGGTAYYLNTNRLFRDVSAWYNILVVYDSSQGTASNRVKFFVNGTQETSFETSNYPAQDVDSELNKANAVRLYSWSGSEYFNGYIAENVFCDGQALAPTSFGVANSDGVWTPIPYSGTFGTNGFNLQFEDAAALGTDSSPNGNTFTVNNLTSIDQSTDYPVVNYCTMNTLYPDGTITFSEGNLKLTEGNSWRSAGGTMAVSQGKWYWEISNVGNYAYIGFADIQLFSEGCSIRESFTTGAATTGRASSVLNSDGRYYQVTSGGAQTSDYPSAATFSTFTNSTIGIALNLDDNNFIFYKDGTAMNPSGNAISITAGTYIPAVSIYGNNVSCNFGSPPYAISSGNADGNGYGNFEYAVPSGYYALNTANLAEFG